jgi:hypothetical protein
MKDVLELGRQAAMRLAHLQGATPEAKLALLGFAWGFAPKPHDREVGDFALDGTRVRRREGYGQGGRRRR